MQAASLRDCMLFASLWNWSHMGMRGQCETYTTRISEIWHIFTIQDVFQPPSDPTCAVLLLTSGRVSTTFSSRERFLQEPRVRLP